MEKSTMQSGAEAPEETHGKGSGFFKAFEGSGGDMGRLEVTWETIQITMYKVKRRLSSGKPSESWPLVSANINRESSSDVD